MNSRKGVNEVKSEIGRRLRRIRGGDSRTRFATKLGVHENTIGGYERGDRFPSSDFLIAVSETHNVNLNWLLMQRGGRYRVPQGAVAPLEHLGMQETHDVSQAGADKTIGFEAYEYEGEIDYLQLPAIVWARLKIDASKARYTIAYGDSMLPTIKDGDVVIVDSTINRVIDDHIYAVVYHGDMLIKRLQRGREKKLTMISDNKLYDNIVIDDPKAEGFHVLGRLVWEGVTI